MLFVEYFFGGFARYQELRKVGQSLPKSHKFLPAGVCVRRRASAFCPRGIPVSTGPRHRPDLQNQGLQNLELPWRRRSSQPELAITSIA